MAVCTLCESYYRKTSKTGLCRNCRSTCPVCKGKRDPNELTKLGKTHENCLCRTCQLARDSTDKQCGVCRVWFKAGKANKSGLCRQCTGTMDLCICNRPKAKNAMLCVKCTYPEPMSEEQKRLAKINANYDKCSCGNRKYKRRDMCYSCRPKSQNYNRVGFTDKHDDFLKKNYPKKGAYWCAENIVGISVTPKQIRSRSNQIGLKVEKKSRIKNLVRGIRRSVIERKRKNPNHFVAQAAMASKSQASKKVPSGPEIKAASILESLGVKYKSQVHDGRWIYDFVVGDIVIEIDGEWWHGHPRYKPWTKKQLEARERDKRKNAHVRKRGMRIRRIWSEEVSKEAITKALR